MLPDGALQLELPTGPFPSAAPKEQKVASKAMT